MPHNLTAAPKLKFHTASLKDDCTRECPTIEVDFSLPGERVVEMLQRVARERGYPDILVVPSRDIASGNALPGNERPGTARSRP